MFALLTGVGAFTGVFLGQLLYASAVWAVAALSHAWQGNAIPTPRTLLFGLEFSVLLAAAAFVSGACWQPVVNLWVFVYGGPVTTPPGNRLFVGVLCGTWLLEGCIFFAALHFWRFVMSKLLRFEAIDAPFTVSTLVYDSSLSMSIGGAAGFFFASSGGGATNLLVRAFGVTLVTPVWRAAFYAGASNVTGFFVSQALQNALFPASTSWAVRASARSENGFRLLLTHVPSGYHLQDLRKKGREQLNKTRSSVLLPYRTPFG